MSLVKASLLTASVLLLTACGTDYSTSYESGFGVPDINGHWVSACHVNSESAGYVSGYFNAISGNMHTELLSTTADGTCKTADLRTTVDSTYKIGEALSTPAESNAFDSTIISIKVTPLSTTMTASLNTNAYCGLTNWQLGVPQEVGNRSCNGNAPSAGRTSYGAIKQSGKILLFGQKTSTNDGSSPAKRPISLNLNDFYSFD